MSVVVVFLVSLVVFGLSMFVLCYHLFGLADSKPTRRLVPTPVSNPKRVERVETSEELTARLRRQEAQQKRAEVVSWEREFQEKLNEAFMPPVPKDYLEVPLNKNTTLHDEPSKWSPRQDVPKDTLIEIGGFVRGDEVQGNPIWYYDKKTGRFFSSSDVDSHPQNLPQFRNESREISHIRGGGGDILATQVSKPEVLSPMTKNPMHLGTPESV